MATTKRKKFTEEEKKAYADGKREEQRQMLADALTKLCSSEGWQQYLETRARFYNYSFFNTILIALQNPEATQVAGSRKWNKDFERRVMDSEFNTNAIKILAPQFVYLKDEAGKIVTDENGKKMIKFVWYKTVEVYDISQTEGEPVAQIPLEPLTGVSHEEYLYRAEQFLQSLGADVAFEVLSTKDWTAREEETRDGKLTFVINEGQPINAQVRELIYSTAEIVATDLFVGLDEEPTNQEKKVMVESAAFMTLQSVGLDTSGISVPHIAKWGTVEDDPKQALLTMKVFADHIDTIAKTVEEGIS